ncbi:peptide ABC transporter permease [Acidianus sp. HS-5]|uniref:peptide ABC transporter permease n=1 Tax=Acidianus sp. HS-5 TaxID=2886040 RepID=UPI001F448CFC|nr:peptide ABC transporter permease [Acidianus sp. HS-5]BDC18052.1 hypothetical protein HS5_09420 [Acidianus sp. HS-5]
MIKVYVSLLFLIFVISGFFTFYELPQGRQLHCPCPSYPLGTYINGENMINMNAEAIINTLIFGIAAGIVETSIAVIYGSIAGLMGGKTRTVMVRISDSINIIPRILLLLSLVLIYGVPTGTSLKANFFITAVLVGLTGWANYARQVSEYLFTSSGLSEIVSKTPFSLLFFSNKEEIYNLSKKFIIPAMIDGISTYTAMGVIAGVGDPRFPTLTTLLTVASRYLPYWWLYLPPALFRAIVIVLLYLISDNLK